MSLNQSNYELFCSLEPILSNFGYEGLSLCRVFSRIVKVPVICTSLEFGYIKSREILESVLTAPRSAPHLKFNEKYSLAA